MGTCVYVVMLLMGVCVLWPQSGYIHPDEFFQSSEVVAGDIFNVTHLRPWEFHPDVPLRDMSLPYLLFAPGFYILRAVLQNPHLSHYVVKSYAVLIIPRLILALAGIISFCLVRKLCHVFLVSKDQAEWYWATSYVTWTFLTRSFSNTTETLLFSLVCLLLLELSHCCSSIRILNAGPEVRQREQHSLKRDCRNFKKYSFVLGCMLCMGIFNRPTFGLFVLAPLMWWVDQLNGAKLKIKFGVMTVVLTGLGFLLTFVVMSLSNSLYYNPEFGHLLNDLHFSILQLDTDAVLQTAHSVMLGMRIPPLNFVRYNLLIANLEQHGLHPWYTHLINFLVLLGPLAFLVYWDVIGLIRRCRQKHSTDVLYAIVVIPILSLSFFPHQEMRFLLPILPVAVVCAARHSLARWKSFKVVVLLFNVLGLIMFGWLHQGGVVPALSWLQARMENIAKDPANYGSHYHVASYTTYMLPQHLLFTNSSRIQVHVHDMIGAHNHPPTLQLRMEELNSSCKNESLVCHFFIMLPATAMTDIQSLVGWKWSKEAEFCPHISSERLPVNIGFKTIEDLYALLPQLCLKVLSVKM